MSHDHDLRLVAPFSPTIIKAAMPQGLVQRLNARIDEIVARRDEVAARDWSAHLAGAVSTEIRFTDVIRETSELTDFLFDVARTYTYRCENALMHFSDYERTEELEAKKLRIEIKEGWINDMVAGDYNPAHFHQGCLYSSVGFLRVPPGYDAEFASDKARQNTAGCLQFIDSRSAVGVKNLFTVKPVVGDFYLWPSWMLHCVYPFRSQGVRRSMAINLALS
ncbi:putative 2OG-Fe(II) oxygenase [Caulobacter endophyticus]|uniref:putative 2OG-Fe(II) oxygenase n=1 Tax=Caulobacter endophyticus TaxID=2172652 RepID=UPI00240FE7BE|nr:putative 2OG-Fe(II) oxygenase [Caulobacter endophyticus]MDG2527864.1 putative 2OG-Fe(II) oxygenase [Caulobacter endophyticus]